MEIKELDPSRDKTTGMILSIDGQKAFTLGARLLEEAKEKAKELKQARLEDFFVSEPNEERILQQHQLVHEIEELHETVELLGQLGHLFKANQCGRSCRSGLEFRKGLEIVYTTQDENDNELPIGILGAIIASALRR